MLKPHWRILIVAALCVAVLVGMIAREASARVGAVEIVLPMAAVDPRSVLSGHYVIVDLREVIPVGGTCEDAAPEVEWLALGPNGETIADAPIYSLLSSAPERDALPTIAQALPVRGTFSCRAPTRGGEDTVPQPGWLRYDLGVERYYTNQAEAMRIQGVMGAQQVGDDTRVYAIIVVGRDGRARISGLIVDGARIDLGWL